MQETRTESDLLGNCEIVADHYWGIHTLRASRELTISGYRVQPDLVRAFAAVKRASAAANCELGYLEKSLAAAIDQAACEVASGSLSDQFPLDALQGSAGTSLNMNVNEVISARAAEILGFERGNRDVVHPIMHVNLHQSTNDVYPTALRIAAIFKLRVLADAVARLQGVFQAKEKSFAHVLKLGRTEWQDAVPITLGFEFSAFAEALGRDRWRTFKCEERLRVVNLGGTAVGTGLTAPRRYIFLAIEKLREYTGLGLARGENLAGETANADAFVEVSGILKALATNLVKICGDLRVMNYLGEIRLPAIQAGSSIMPGKVNPVLVETVIQVGLKVMANDFLVAESASRGSSQICEFLPLIAHSLLESLDLLCAVSSRLASHVEGIEACEQECLRRVQQSTTTITAFLPLIGYEKATELVLEYHKQEGKNFREFLEEYFGKETVSCVLEPGSVTSLGYQSRKGRTGYAENPKGK